MLKNSSKQASVHLPDIQNLSDGREIPIDKVGVKNIRYPIVVKDRDNEIQHTIAVINMTVDLPKEFKGTHMSRFIEILQCKENEIHVDSIESILTDMQKKLHSTISHIEIEFPYFMKKKAPVSGKFSLIDYVAKFHAMKNRNKFDFILGVKVPVTTLCPCSKNISKYGAHNQRGEVSIFVRFKDTVWIEDLIEIAEESSSCELFSLLKREDEKFVTEKAYDNPVFVEDLVRNAAQMLKQNKNVTWFSVEAENFESIHNHNAYAHIESDKKVDGDFMIQRY